MKYIQIPFAVGIALVWFFAVYEATRKPELVGLVTVITPVMLGASVFLLGQPVIQALRKSNGSNVSKETTDEKETP